MNLEIPRHCVIHVGFMDKDTSLAVMCKGVRFYIQIEIRNMHETDKTATHMLEEQYLNFRDLMDNGLDVEEEFEDWAIEPCLPHIRRATASITQSVALTISQYFQPPTIFLQLSAEHGTLQARQYPGTASIAARLAPKVHLSHLMNVPLSQLQSVPRMEASELRIVPAHGNEFEYKYCTMPRVVQHLRTGELLYFKATQDSESLSNELRVHLCVRDKTGASDQWRLPKLLAVVEWEETGGPIMGFVTEYIRNAGTLRGAASRQHSRETREEWMRQITETVYMLHGLGLVWGDVKPDNVLVDLNGAARVIDFGGGFSPTWVDQELAGTKEGDLQGVTRMKAFLGLQESITGGSG